MKNKTREMISMTVKDIIRVAENNALIYPNFQRGNHSTQNPTERGTAWKDPIRQGVIYATLEDGMVPPIVLRNMGNKTFQVLDGQQRIGAIMRFYHNKLKLEDMTLIGKKDVSKFTFEDLPKKLKNTFLAYKVDVSLNVLSDEKAAHLYTNLQRGIQLTGQEVRRSYVNSKVRGLIYNSLSKLPIFSVFKNIRATGDRIEHLATQMLLLRLTDGCVAIGGGALDKIYKADPPPKKLHTAHMETKKTLKLMNKAFSNNIKTVKANELISLFCVTTVLQSKGAFKDVSLKLDDWLVDFREARQRYNDGKNGIIQDDATITFDTYFWSVYDGATNNGSCSLKSLKNRTNIMLKHMFKTKVVPTLYEVEKSF